MFEYGIRAPHIENPFPRVTTPTTTTESTKMNDITPIIPKDVRNIMDLVFVVVGVNLNVFLDLFIMLNSTLYNSTNCYIMGLTISNLVILLEPLERILEWIFDIHLNMNLDYIFLMSFATSMVTMVLLNIEGYIIICQKNSPFRKSFVKISTAIKGILMTWATCIMMTAMELRLYDFFEEEIIFDIFGSFTVMFLIFPYFIFIMLGYFILYDLIISKSINGTWPRKDVKHFIFLISINIGFFLIMVPYRITRTIAVITNTRFRYKDIVLEITYTMVKVHPIILPIIYFVTSKEFRQTFKMRLHCQRIKTSTI